MSVTTSVYIHDPVDYRIVFARCAVLIGAPARTRVSVHPVMVPYSGSTGQRTVLAERGSA